METSATTNSPTVTDSQPSSASTPPPPIATIVDPAPKKSKNKKKNTEDIQKDTQKDTQKATKGGKKNVNKKLAANVLAVAAATVNEESEAVATAKPKKTTKEGASRNGAKAKPKVKEDKLGGDEENDEPTVTATNKTVANKKKKKADGKKVDGKKVDGKKVDGKMANDSTVTATPQTIELDAADEKTTTVDAPKTAPKSSPKAKKRKAEDTQEEAPVTATKKTKKSKRSTTNEEGATAAGCNACPLKTSPVNLPILIRHHGKIPFAKPVVLEWSPVPAKSNDEKKPSASTETYQYLRIPAAEDITVKPLTCQIVDLKFGLQFTNNHNHTQWFVHNWEPLLNEGLTVHYSQPLQHNIVLLLHNCTEKPIDIKQGDPLAVIRFHPLPQKLSLTYLPMNTN